MTRKTKTINQIVGIKDNEIWILKDCFKYSDSSKGCTGYSMSPLTQDYIDEMNDISYLKSEYAYAWKDAVYTDQRN